MTKKVALVTGCSSGFGLLIAIALANSGFKVFASMRNLAKANNLETQIKQLQLDIAIIPLDVTKEESIHKAIHHILAEHRTIDLVVNNAGIGIGGFAEETPLSDTREVFETNFFGPVQIMKSVLPLMRNQKGGRIINISSITALFPQPGIASYCASKSALLTYSESVRYEAKTDGIEIITLLPGAYNTEIFSSNLRVSKEAENPESPHFPMVVKIQKKLMARLKKNKEDPNEVAEMVVHVSTVQNPRSIYSVGKEAKIAYLIKKILPNRLIEWAIYHYWFK